MQNYYEKIRPYIIKLEIYKKKIGVITVVVLLFIFSFYFYRVFIMPPTEFEARTVFIIEKGDSLYTVTNKLVSENYIRNAFVFRNIVILFGGERNIRAGEYFFSRKVNSISIALKIITADYGNKEIKVTIHEGLNRYEIAELLGKKLPEFSKEKFLALTDRDEGYLFPDTYYFRVQTRESTIISTMEENFISKTKDLRIMADKKGKEFSDIIIMASIIEDEATAIEDKKIISDILWSRIAIDMPLQVDATFKYLLNKKSSEITLSDLKIDSKYNTYKYKGLPEGPINSPGVHSISAALNPIKNDYLYFLTDATGKMHYSNNYQKFLADKKLYIR